MPFINNHQGREKLIKLLLLRILPTQKLFLKIVRSFLLQQFPSMRTVKSTLKFPLSKFHLSDFDAYSMKHTLYLCQLCNFIPCLPKWKQKNGNVPLLMSLSDITPGLAWQQRLCRSNLEMSYSTVCYKPLMNLFTLVMNYYNEECMCMILKVFSTT